MRLHSLVFTLLVLFPSAGTVCSAGRLRLAGGYVGLANGNSARRYSVRDHLGSVRAVVNDAGTVLETDDYYPLGGPLPTGSNTALQPEKYQGKDWNTAASFNVYDFGARLYDPALGRWLAQDPLAEKFYPQSPYLFCAGNPMKFVDTTGQEWKEKNKIISVSLNLMAEGFDDDFLDTYKKTVSTMFDEIIRSASGGSYGGEIVFYTNNPDIVQSLSFVASMDNSIGGTTTWMYSNINPYDNSGKIQSFTELAKTTIHELFHTIRLEHPFEKTHTRDTQLIKIGPNSYNTTAFTDPNIVNNIMNYSFISIDGKYGNDMRYITKGQFEFIRKEIYLQYLGYGYNKKFDDYWESFPGLPVGY